MVVQVRKRLHDPPNDLDPILETGPGDRVPRLQDQQLHRVDANPRSSACPHEPDQMRRVAAADIENDRLWTQIDRCLLLHHVGAARTDAPVEQLIEIPGRGTVDA